VISTSTTTTISIAIPTSTAAIATTSTAATASMAVTSGNTTRNTAAARRMEIAGQRTGLAALRAVIH
jgi:hypothetical protein